MHKPASIYQLLTVIFIYCCGCNAADNNPAGGSCTYTYDTMPARIISIDSIDSIDNSNRNLVLVLEKAGILYSDTIDSHGVLHRYTTTEELQLKDIGLNDTLLLVKGKLLTGSCNPDAGTTLLLEHYKK